MLRRGLFFTLSFFVMLLLIACGQTKIELPDLNGLNVDSAQTQLSTLPITVLIEYEESSTIADSVFIRYGEGLEAGNKVDANSDITVYFSINYPELPDLTGLSKTEIQTALDNLDLNYSIQYTTNNTIEENIFVAYGGSDQTGDTISDNHEIIVYIATSRLVLPDLDGKNQSEILSALLAADIDFTIEIVTDNEVPDQTFSGYGDGLEAGDLVPTSFKVTVYLGYNSPTLPDLTGMLKGQITKVLDEQNISYQFNYIVNDNFAEDLFAGYESQQIGDFYLNNTVVIDLYKNTFTDNSESLFISKYVDGGDDTSDQAIEIYNPTDSNIDLSNYHLVIYTNGSYTISYSIAFANVDLLPGETYVIANSSANSNILNKADLASSDLVFDGNDTIQLCYSNGTYIDSIYNISNKQFVMDNEVFVRDASVVKGERAYQYNQWHGFVPTYVEILGTFPVQTDYEVNFNFIDRPFTDPLGGMDSVTLTGIADGDTAYFTPGFLGEQRVRFVGVDTPETYPVVDPWGPEAKEYTKFVLNHAEGIYIESDPDIGLYGNYGRSLGLVWVNVGSTELTYDILSSTGTVMRTDHLTGWILLNYHLVLNGYSYNYYSGDSTLTFDNRYLFRLFQEAEQFASDNGLGIHE